LERILIMSLKSKMPFQVWLLTLSAFAIGVAEFVIASVLPQVTGSLGVTEGQAGHLITAYALAIVIGGPILTLWLARFGSASRSADSEPDGTSRPSWTALRTCRRIACGDWPNTRTNARRDVRGREAQPASMNNMVGMANGSTANRRKEPKMIT
jgi:hypothetical protein